MVTPTYPGVYVEEVAGGVRSLQVAGTSTAAFVGLAERGPTEATRVTNWTEFQRLYGTFVEGSHLAHSVFQFFNNGGRDCYVVRVVRPDAVKASVTVNNQAQAAVAGWKFSARSVGTWGNTLVLQIEDGTHDPRNEFKLSVRRQVDAAVVPKNFNETPPLEVFDDLSPDPSAARFVGDVLAQQSQLIDAEMLSANTSAQNGVLMGGAAPNLPLGDSLDFQISLDGDGFQTVKLPATAGTATALADVAAAIQTAVTALQPTKTNRKASASGTAFTGFTCGAEGTGADARLRLTSGTSSPTSSVRVEQATANDAAKALKLGPGRGSWFQDGAAPRRPMNADTVEVGDAAAGGAVVSADPGTDGDELSHPMTPKTYSDSFQALDTVTDFSLLAVPGVGDPAMFALGTEYCANRPLKDVFYIGEPPPDKKTVADVQDFRKQLTSANSYGAVYFPWVKALDPTGRSRDPVLAPPSGYIAGLYARIDASRGVWKAPAGVEASLNGVVGLAVELGDTDHGLLNPVGVDVIRRFPGAGIVSFGARTVSSDPLWDYVPVRRTAIMLRVSIYYGIQWAVFEPNDESLWSQLRLSIGSFMTTLFRKGAFQGSTPSQGFFVKCDDETTTQADIDAGVVNVQVGFAPLKPAEFVVVELSQKAGLASG